MIISVKNTGKISSAQITVDGITVIAGANNTGKSTISKVLFCIINSFYKIDQQIERERKNRISKIFESYFNEAGLIRALGFDPLEFAEIIANKETDYSNKETIEADVRDLCLQADKSFEKYIGPTFLSGIAEKVMQIINISNKEILVAVLKKRLLGEFNMQINNIYSPDLLSEMKLTIEDKEIDLSVFKDEQISMTDTHSLSTEVLYIDDPFAIDDLQQFRPYLYNHRDHLRSKLRKIRDESPIRDAIDEIIATKKLEKVFFELNKVCKGELIRSTSPLRPTMAYQERDSETALDMQNISTGVKTFVIIKTLLLNGSLEENGILVLAEPEIHLHPEWQLVFARLIVLLHKEFNLHIMLNTHSPYFLNAIEVFSHRYGVAEKCKYYLAEDSERTASITDVSNNIEIIYDRLSRPFQILENERYYND